MKKNPVVLVEKKENGTAIITLNRPEKNNCLNHELKLGIFNALNELDNDESVGSIVMKGAGRHFCTGQDYNEVVLGNDYRHLDNYRKIFGTECTNIFNKMMDIGLPVIGAVHGVVTGEGFPLCAACDIVYAAEGTVFQFPGTNLGGLSVGPAVLISRYFPIKRTLEHLFSGEPILAEEALQYGLINKIVPQDKLEETAMKLADKIASLARQNRPAVKELGKGVFYTTLDMERSKAIKIAHQMMAQMFITPPVVDLGKALLEGKVSYKDRQLEGLVKK
jgi:enoyl-CoA hydratase/carnithine racemase